MPWTALPDGQALALAPGELVAIVASVKASHSAQDLAAFARARGLSLVDYAEEGQRVGLGPDPRGPDYRYVAAIARVGKAGSVPWSVPFPLSMFDKSALVRAWSEPDPGGTTAPAPPAPPAPVRVDVSPVPLWPLALIPAAAIALRLARKKRAA